MSATSIHITALDGIVNVNSLFTLAVFIGLAWNPTDPNNSLVDPIQHPGCTPGPKVAENLITFHVYSFSCFLFSSLVALGLKQVVRLVRGGAHHHHNHEDRVLWPAFDLAHINRTALRVGYVVSAAGSVCGSVFLMLALVNVVQIKLGMLGCAGGSRHGYGAVVPLFILVPSGLLIYVCTVFYAFTR
ncbi:hypothetical protein ABFS82_06G072100 [Erythranthe guttata]|uniref:Maternal effect embryo arrest 60 n=1 Tax=Erythranthe guttata TaxID=4155 RepID=A0A022PW04_ERYGU|nr:PREDICTED: uncharacterized protein LOC105977557 [Erythranthe guttata]EYU19956.1 hypothetical protein MIMGU_mgv1a014525mg [Erythranthe guttata]|eukprot:XP_012858331.1 PREDICTED: uncharacterized protein LOC105977557 [Erythranthe guttata]